MDLNHDPDTGEQHVSPAGLEHQSRRNNGKGRWYSCVHMPHYIIKLHQEAFPDLEKKMDCTPNASNIYGAFIAMIPLELKGKLTPELRRQIMKSFKLI